MPSHEESQKMLTRKMIAFIASMKKFDEEFAQPDKSLGNEQTWDSIEIPSAKTALFLEAYARYEKLNLKEQKARMEIVGDGLDETFDIDAKRSPKDQEEFVKQQAVFLVSSVIKFMQQDDIVKEIIEAPVDMEGLKIFAQAAAEEKEERKARAAAKSGGSKSGQA